MKIRLQTKIRISSGKVRVKNFATSHKEVVTPPEKTTRLNAKQQKSSSCDSKKGPRVRENQPFVLYFDTHFLLDRGLQLLPYRLKHNPQTDKTSEMPRDKTTLCFRSTTCLFFRL